MSKAAAALAHELGLHIDDLVDTHETALQTPDGETAGDVADTHPATNDMSFYVVMGDGTKLLVQVSEAPQLRVYPCYGGQWIVHAPHDYPTQSGAMLHCEGKTADTVLGAKPDLHAQTCQVPLCPRCFPKPEATE